MLRLIIGRAGSGKTSAMIAEIAEAVRRAYHAVLDVKFDGMFYRTDIAYRALRRLETT